MLGPVMGGLSAGIQEEVSRWQWAVREDFACRRTWKLPLSESGLAMRREGRLNLKVTQFEPVPFLEHFIASVCFFPILARFIHLSSEKSQVRPLTISLWDFLANT